MSEIKVESNIKSLELYSDEYPFRLQLRIKNFENETEYKKFIRNCEAMLRKSNEYKLWRKYLVDVLRVNHCSITHEVIEEVTIDIHHHIPSLYTLISALVNKKLDIGSEFCTFDLCKEIIELHFQNKVGYVTLLKSMHEKFHNGSLDIPVSLVKGNYKQFLKDYTSYIDETQLDTVNERLAVNESNCSWSKENYPAAAGGNI